MCLALAAPAQAQTASSGTTITITDNAVSPSTLTITTGQSVTWVNKSQIVQDVVTNTGIAPTIDSGGMDKGQTFTTKPFTAAGTFPYHSTMQPTYSQDSSGNVYTTWAITGTVIVVDAPAGAVAGGAPGACQFVLGFKTLHDLDAADIGDCSENQSFQPNGDAQQHTTKGLLAWRKADNWTAFTNGYKTWINGPAGLVNRLNTDRFPWEHDTPAPAAASAAPTPVPTQAPDPTVTIDDQNGFTPNYITITAGHTVIWVNKGRQPHSVVNDNGDPPFDSSVLMPGQQYSYNFTQAGGHYTYHSTTEPTHMYKNVDGVDTIGYQFTGTLVVQ